MLKTILKIVLESLPLLLELLKETDKQNRENETDNTKKQENDFCEETTKMEHSPNPIHDIHS